MEGAHNKTNTSGTAAIGQGSPDIIYFVYERCIVLLLYLLALLGLAGNAINIMVLRKHGITKDSTNVMLVSLSFFDFMYSLIVLIRKSVYFLVLVDVKLAVHINSMFAYYSLDLIEQICTSTSVTITSAIAIERFVAVFFPFKVARIFTPVRVKLVVIFIVFYVFGLTSPIFGRYKIVTLLNAKNVTQIVIMESGFWVSSGMNYYTLIWCNNLLTTANMAIVFLCGATTTLKLVYLAHTRQRLTSNKTPAADMKAHKMILIVCGACFLVFFPTTALDIAVAYGVRLNDYTKFVANVLYGVHASVNFIIYVAVSQKFYTTYKNMISRWF